MFASMHAPGSLSLLVECACRFSPLIEETSPDTVTLDVRGMGRMFGAPRQLAAAMERQAGVTVAVAIAPNPDAAIHAARGFEGVTIVPPGMEASILAPLPLHLLGGSHEIAHQLNLWGIRTFGEFAKLPPLGVAARLGEEGAYLQRLAQGVGERQLRLRVEAMAFRMERELEEPIHTLEPLVAVFAEALDGLCGQLRFHGRATNELRARLKLERMADHRIRLRLPTPMLDAKVLLKLVQLELQERPPQSPVKRVFLELLPVEPRAAQYGLFLPLTPEPEKLEITLARIRGLVGAENVGAPQLLDTHRPDAYRLEALAHSKGGARPLYVKLAFRRFRPAWPAQVWCSHQGQPVRVASPNLISTPSDGTVIACAGPWSSAGDWWTQKEWDCMEWDVELAGLGVFRLTKDCRQSRWRVDGAYD